MESIVSKARLNMIPPRIADRPRPEQWGPDELLTLPEAAALFWPCGPLSTRSLRTAVRDRQLATVTIAGKMLTTKRHLTRMSEPAANVSPDQPETEGMVLGPLSSGTITFDQLLAAKLQTARA